MPGGLQRLVAGLAVCAESRLGVIGIIGRHKIIHMTSVAVNGRPAKFVDLLIDMAGLAVRNGMNPHQGKIPFTVKGKNLTLVFPTVRGVTALTINPKLTLVNVRMAA